MMQKVQIFPVTFFKTSVDDNEAVKKILVPKIMEVTANLPVPKGWLTNKIMTSFGGEELRKEIFYGEDNPIRQIRCTSYELNEHEYGESYYPNIEEGDFIMFPSYLIHSVEPSPPTPDYPRITIAMNIRVLEYGH